MRNKTFVWIMPLIALFLFSTCKKDDDNERNLVKDFDGNMYDSVTIGTQTWMKENLKTTHYNDGSAIPNVTGDGIWGGLTTGAYCYYDNNAANGAAFGALYNWYTVNTGKLCPTGWHVPSDAEWTTLTDYLGGESVAGGKLKETGTEHWESPNTGATNESGFSALPGGFRGSNGAFFGIGYVSNWWSATEYYAANVWGRYLNYDEAQVLRGYGHGNMGDGFSVRCLKDY